MIAARIGNAARVFPTERNNDSECPDLPFPGEDRETSGSDLSSADYASPFLQKYVKETERVKRIVQSSEFGALIQGCIMLTGILAGLETYDEIKSHPFVEVRAIARIARKLKKASC